MLRQTYLQRYIMIYVIFYRQINVSTMINDTIAENKTNILTYLPNYSLKIDLKFLTFPDDNDRKLTGVE